MKLSIYSIYDTKTKTYGELFTSTHFVVTERQLYNLLNSPQSPFRGFEKSFELHQLGHFYNDLSDCENISSLEPKFFNFGTIDQFMKFEKNMNDKEVLDEKRIN